nr:ACP phosphodiesterase [Oceanisphaera litoralis]
MAHLHLAHYSNTSLPGALLGEYARGSIDTRLPPSLQLGIRLHRHIDSFTDAHPLHAGAVRALPSPFRRYGGIIMDMMFDHFLARHWSRYHAWELDDFIGYSHRQLQPDEHWPEAMVILVERLKQYRLLTSYQSLEGISLAIARIDGRFRRPTPLPQCAPLLAQQYGAMEQAFLGFYPELQAFVLGQSRQARALGLAG